MDKGIFAQLLEEINKEKNVVVMTKFAGDTGNQEEIEKKILTEDQCDKMAIRAISDGIPIFTREQDTNILVEPFFPEERLIILGGGHIAVPLADFSSKVGFSVIVVDDRPSFANRQRFPLASDVICDSFESAIQHLHITPRDYVVIITRGHRHDKDCIAKLLCGNEPYYTGMIGSRRRVSLVIDDLMEQGGDKDRLDHIHTPIGLSIGAVTPQEIAVSILAELVAAKRLRICCTLRDRRYENRSDVDMEVLRVLAAEKEEPKSIVTVISSQGSVPRGAGAKMLVYPYGRIIGSIGGGCSESAVVSDARRIIGSGGYRLVTVDLTGDTAEDEGMVCGGIMQVLIEDF